MVAAGVGADANLVAVVVVATMLSMAVLGALVTRAYVGHVAQAGGKSTTALS